MSTDAGQRLPYTDGGVTSDLDVVVVHNLLRTHSYLCPFIDAGLRQRNLTAAQLNAMLVLQAAGDEGLMMGEIGKRLVVTKSNVTGLIDRLERQGFVARCEHRDRRAKPVRLTDVGAKLLARTLPRHAELLTELTGCLTDREKRALIRTLTKLRRGLRRQRKEDA